MKLRNKKTGEIGKLHCDMNVSPAKYGVFEDTGIRGHYWEYNSLAELNAEWEDAPEELKEFWFIDDEGGVECGTIFEFEEKLNLMKSIGNYFETKEEAEKSVEKLKAWERLKDKGFRLEGIRQDYTRFNQQEPMMCGRKYLQFNKSEDEEWMKDNWEDLDLLFGGEE